MPQIVVRQLSEEIHRALKALASAHGRSAEAEARAIIAQAVLPETRAKAGDVMTGIWRGAELADVTFERDKTPHDPLTFE